MILVWFWFGSSLDGLAAPHEREPAGHRPVKEQCRAAHIFLIDGPMPDKLPRIFYQKENQGHHPAQAGREGQR
jgi:hypothetical protein